MRDIEIAGRKIGYNHPCFTIAEVGVNHNGNLEIAKQLIDIATEAGVDAVKFQTYNVPDLVLPNVEKAPYQISINGDYESQNTMLQRLQIDEGFHKILIDYCRKNNIIFLSTPYDEASLNLLIKLGISAIKVASTDATNLLFLEMVASTGKPVILSTGMCSLSEIEKAYYCLRENGCEELALLKCTSSYPTTPDEVNLKSMLALSNIFDAIIGFSDHTDGIGASPYAIAMGAKIVEKHFTLDKTMDGPDHKASLSPEELRQWIREIKKVEKMLGFSEINPTNNELRNKKILQKNLVSKRDIERNEVLSRENIVAKRTGGNGIPASMVYEVLGLKVKQKAEKNKPIYWWLLED